MINHKLTVNDLHPSAWVEQFSTQLVSTHSVVQACVGWVFELGTSPEMTFLQRKNLALINSIAFASLLLALPGTFILMLMGFSHPFSLLISGVLAACLVLGFNGARRVEWSKALFAFAPSAIILAYTMLELSSQWLGQPLNYILIRQGLCLALLIPIIIYGFDARPKTSIVTAICVLIFIVFDLGSIRLGAFGLQQNRGLSQGLFSLLSLFQYVALLGCVRYMQAYTLQHVEQSQRDNEKLQSMAVRDGLTGLLNRSFMEHLITDAINRAKRSQDPLALLMIDVDFFKQVNDTFGHNAGDEVLVALTRLLNSSTRSTDYLGRWGGDELVMLLTDTNLAGATNLAEKLRRLVENQAFPHGKHLTISLGASEYQPGESTTSFIGRADAAMYRAKHAGRNRVDLPAVIY